MGFVVLYGRGRNNHDEETCAGIARELATIKGYEFDGQFEPSRRYDRPVYFVPTATIDVATARALDIRSVEQLFGGVVPHDFVGTKVIAHSLVDERARAPAGWSRSFTHAITDVVLDGYSAFSIEDAREAARRMLDGGPVRLKLPEGVGGRGQHVVCNLAELDRVLAQLDARSIDGNGVVLEENLVGDVATYSVGQVAVDDIVMTYVGTQRLTPDNDGHPVYGGSSLVIARGDFDALLALPLDDGQRDAIARTRVFDDAVHVHYPAFFASRRNYDVATGRNANGRPRTGVLEQSWRIGGASGVELAGLGAFRSDPRIVEVRASCRELYGEDATVPPDAKVYFDGNDGASGRLLKYTVVESHVAR